MENLFVDDALTFEKVAAEVELAEDPNMWPDEILQELYKQVSYVADFQPHIQMDRVDGEKGYGFGHVEVSGKTEIPSSNPEGQHAAGIKMVRIPIIINRHKLQPFDVLVTEDSKMLPLTENRLRQALFRPQAFDMTARTPGDHSMIGQLYPPFRQNYGMGGGGTTVSAGMGKEGSARFSILEAIRPTIRNSDIEKFASSLTDTTVQANFVRNKFANKRALSTLLTAHEEKTASVDEYLKPSVVQIQRAPGGYSVKTAHHNFWDPQEKTITRTEALHKFGNKLVFAADMSDGVTVSDGAGAPPVPVGAQGPAEAGGPAPEANMGPTVSAEDDRYELIKDYGLYKVKTEEGQELVGYVFPNLLDLDGKALPIALFTNGSASAVQGEIVGVRAGEGQSLPQGGRPRGHGVFYRVLPNGKAEATLPIDCNASLDSGGDAVFMAETFDGQQVQIVGFQPNIKDIQMVDGHVLVPETFNWLPLDQGQEVSLVSSPEEPAKMASLQRLERAVFIRGFDGEFSIEGAPLSKLAAPARELRLNDALFLLAGLGVPEKVAHAALGESMVISAPVEVATTRDIRPMSDRLEEATKVAEESLASIPQLQRNLTKEAAVIPDPMAVDTVLSIGFIHPENVIMFVEALPVIDEAQQKLCELLIASRLGLRDIPANALENAVRNVEQVIEGLKVIAFQQN